LKKGLGVQMNLIGGEWKQSSGELENCNPSDLSDVVGIYALGDESHVDSAVACARESLGAWKDAGIQARAKLLGRVGARLYASREDLGKLLAREEGKTLAEAVAEVTRAAQVFKFFFR
jgi:acyl-CoA reductase-like NAD-dependent aldehyde dehydrogenase